ncbi:putative AC transposase [Aphis craccivora]|uniref:Putative AC transposase n=1 Tax=Aphis craccivora TaxID=307492 RepID=A0A6G0VQ88_APHCR|nr:putative AC transposase [Aphis craccivora]
MENEDTNNLEADDECSEGESFSSSDDSDTNDSTNNDSSDSDGIIEDLDCKNTSSLASDVNIIENDIIDVHMEEEVTQIDTNSFVLVNFFGNTLTTKNQVFKYVCMVKST